MRKLAHGQTKLFVVLLLTVATSCSSLKKKRQKQVSITTEQRDLLLKYEKLIGGEIPPQQAALYTFIDAWWGVPHRIGGADKSGVDCSGFVVGLFDAVYGKQVPRTTEGLVAAAKPVDTSLLVTGDLVFIAFQGRKKVSHVGVYLQDGKFVHASTSKGVRIDYMRDSYYKKQQFSGGRMP